MQPVCQPCVKKISGVKTKKKCDLDKKLGLKKSILNKLECKVNEIKCKVENKSCDTFKLTQSDFDSGSYMITKPGKYVLQSDIVFGPDGTGDTGLPAPPATPMFQLGWFAAIIVSCECVIIDLNGFTLRSGKRFRLEQRFFALIELANSPFLAGQGPGNFTTAADFKGVKYVHITNGTIGLSSHHGIHGNSGSDVAITNLVVRDFEVGGIHLNGFDNYVIEDVCVGPAIGEFNTEYPRVGASALLANKIFTSDITQLALDSGDLTSTGASGLVADLKTEIADEQLLLLTTETGLINPDGIVYGIVLNKIGAAAGELTDEGEIFEPSQCGLVRRVKIQGLVSEPMERIGVAKDGHVLHGPSGEVIRIQELLADPSLGLQSPAGTGDTLTQLHFELMDQLLSDPSLKIGVMTTGTCLLNDAVDFYNGTGTLEDLISMTGYQLTSSDMQAHNPKPAFSLRLDGQHYVCVQDIVIKDVVNRSKAAEDRLNVPKCSLPNSRYNGFMQSHQVAFGMSYDFGIIINNVCIETVESDNGQAVGILSQNKSRYVSLDMTEIKGVTVNNLGTTGSPLINYYDEDVLFTFDRRDKVPTATGIRQQPDSKINIARVKISELAASLIQYESVDDACEKA
jgi:hypothetical protein